MASIKIFKIQKFWIFKSGFLIGHGWEAMSPGSMVIAVGDLNGQSGMIQIQRGRKIIITKGSYQECFRNVLKVLSLKNSSWYSWRDFHTKGKAFVGLWFHRNFGFSQFCAIMVAITASA